MLSGIWVRTCWAPLPNRRSRADRLRTLRVLHVFDRDSRERRHGWAALPGVELNYGLIPNGQLTIDTVAAFDSPSGGPMQFGYGDTPISFKYRFIQEDSRVGDRKLRFRWSICPPATKTAGSGQATS